MKDISQKIEAYNRFLAAKMELARAVGKPCEASDVNPLGRPDQRDVIQWGVRGGRRAYFMAFGLGKSFVQIETARILHKHTSGRVLQVAPLAVRHDFIQDARLDTPEWRARANAIDLDYDRIVREYSVDYQFVQKTHQVGGEGFYLTNYESVRDRKIDVDLFDVVLLDEASILRGFGGTKTFREFMRIFEGTATYRFVATATPSPNEFIELLAYAAFLDIMDVGQAKTRFFERNNEKADQLTLLPHKEREFWLWVSSWAVFLERPSDLGYSDEGFELPEMEVHWHEIPSEHTGAGHETSGQGRLLRNAALGVTEAAREKRDSLPNRIAKLKEIIDANARAASGLPEDILRKEQRDPASEAKGAREAELPSQSAEVPGALGTMEGEQSTTLSRALSEKQGAESGQDQGEKRPVVSGQQVPGGCDGSEEQIEEVRHDTEEFRCAVGKTNGSVPDMSHGPQESRDRSRSQDGSGARNLMPTVQCGDGAFPGQPRNTNEGRRVLDQFIVWCDLNKEQEAIDALCRESQIPHTSLYGRDDIDTRDDMLAEWRSRKTTALITKPSMYGAGVNLQQCHIAIFAGIGFKFEEFFQATKRIHRFLQKRPVQIHIIYTEAEREVRRSLERKWEQHKVLAAQMSAIIRKYGLASNTVHGELMRSMGCERKEVTGSAFTAVNNDTVVETMTMADNSAGLILTSIPFSTQYEYTPSYNDFGHTDSNEHFWRQMDFLIPELYRVLQPGRNAIIHVKDRIVPGGMSGHGFQTVYPFHMDCHRQFTRHGFAYLGMKTIVTDVVRENNQTYRLGWTEQCKDGSRMGVGMPEYLMLFRKPPTDSSNGYADLPVVKEKTKYSRSRWQIDAHGFARSSGNRLLTVDDLAVIQKHDQIFKAFRSDQYLNTYDYERHVALSECLELCRSCGHIHTGQKSCGHVNEEDCSKCGGTGEICFSSTSYGSCPECQGGGVSRSECDCLKSGGILPVTFMLLQPQSLSDDVWTDVARMRTLNSAQSAAGREQHLCPLQFDIANRVIEQFSMPGELVFDPFSGIGTVPMCAVKLGRRGRGHELSPDYFVDSVGYLRATEAEVSMPTLFDLMEEGAA